MWVAWRAVGPALGLVVGMGMAFIAWLSRGADRRTQAGWRRGWVWEDLYPQGCPRRAVLVPQSMSPSLGSYWFMLATLPVARRLQQLQAGSAPALRGESA